MQACEHFLTCHFTTIVSSHTVGDSHDKPVALVEFDHGSVVFVPHILVSYKYHVFVVFPYQSDIA